jgi:hypothetical protein
LTKYIFSFILILYLNTTGCPLLYKKREWERTVRTAISLWASQHVVLDHPLVSLMYKNIACVAHLHRKLKIFGTTWLQFLKLEVFNIVMHTITGNQINLFLYKRISDMCTVTFKNYECMIFHVQFDASTVVKIHPLVF